jgi:biopolymer transport protein TolR
VTAPAVRSAEPNITPMIDVLLVLLIVFMVTVIQVRQSMDANLSQPCTASCPSGNAIVLEVLPGPTYRVNQEPVAPSELRERLTGIYRNRPDKIIQIAGHPGARYADVVSAMDVAKTAGVRVLSIAPKDFR